ncbi:MAG TPA: hypothetical protein VN442_09140 [Bryobacteraceae bacterium]|nr:hypothetical protein [Bryobacteraceae bacterium]
MTKAEIQEASGASVSDGVVNAGNKSVCDYKVGNTGSVIGIMLVDKAPGESADKMVAELKKRKINAQIAPGIGDGAYTSAPGYGMQQLGAYKGSKHVIVTVMMMGAPEAKARAVADKVARKAIGKL